MHLEPLASFSRSLASSGASPDWEKEVCFVLLQLINGLKYLQAQGIEDADLSHFLLTHEDATAHKRLIIVEGAPAEERLGLCRTAIDVIRRIFGAPDDDALPDRPDSVQLFRTMTELLRANGSMALGQVKSMLEFKLWGPSDATSDQQVLQHWLDLERATVLNDIIRSQGLLHIELDVHEEYHLLFLVRTCAKTLREAAMLFRTM